ncbi:MAG: MDR family MFS transporter [Propionibacteriaceae bacterium]
MNSPVASPSPAATSMSARDRLIIGTLLIAAFVVILNETIMGVALPRLMVELQVDESTGQWLATAFMLTMAVVIPATGYLLQRFPTRTVFLFAMGLFSAGTLLAAVAPGFGVLLVARIVQGSGTAIMVPLLMTTVLNLVPPERRGVVMGNVSIAISVAPAIGPTLSGVILEYLSWRFMFILVLPIALAAMAFGAAKLVDVSEPGHQSLDVLSVLLSVPAFGGLVFGLSRIGTIATDGVASVIISLAVGLVAMALFVWRQIALRDASPLLDLRVFGYRMYRRGLLVMVIAMLALFGMVILLPIYLQNIRHLTPMQTGLMMLPGGLLMGLVAPTVGKLFDRYGPRVLTVTGATLLTLMMWRLSTIDAGTSVWLLLGYHLVLSLGLACLFTPSFTTALNPLPPHLYSHGSAALGTLQQVAGGAGTALLVTVMAGRSYALAAEGATESAAQIGGIQAAFGVAAVISIAVIGLAFLLRRSTPEVPVEEEPAEATADLR